MIFSKFIGRDVCSMKILTRLIAMIAMLVVGSANMGCVVLLCEEPQSLESLMD